MDDGREVNYPSWETILSVQQVSSLSQEFAIVAVIIISNQRDMESGMGLAIYRPCHQHPTLCGDGLHNYKIECFPQEYTEEMINIPLTVIDFRLVDPKMRCVDTGRDDSIRYRNQIFRGTFQSWLMRNILNIIGRQE